MMIRLLLVSIICLSLTGCFDVVEEVDMKSNGSGNIKATVNLSKSKTKVSSLMSLDKVDGVKIPTEKEIKTEFNNVVQILRQTAGISNVRHSLDLTDYIATLSCDFSDVKALNAFNKTLSDHFKTNLSGYSSYQYNASQKSFVRTNKYSPDAKKEFDKLSADSKKNFYDAYFTSIYRFDKEVKASNNTLARVSPNKRAVMLKTTVVDLINGKANLSNTITLNH